MTVKTEVLPSFSGREHGASSCISCYGFVVVKIDQKSCLGTLIVERYFNLKMFPKLNNQLCERGDLYNRLTLCTSPCTSLNIQVKIDQRSGLDTLIVERYVNLKNVPKTT
jgi:hypothetical protein